MTTNKSYKPSVGLKTKIHKTSWFILFLSFPLLSLNFIVQLFDICLSLVVLNVFYKYSLSRHQYGSEQFNR